MQNDDRTTVPTSNFTTSKGVYLEPELARRLARAAWSQHTTAAALLRRGMADYISTDDAGDDPGAWGEPPPSGSHHMNLRTTEEAWADFNDAAWRCGMVMSSAFRLVAWREANS